MKKFEVIREDSGGYKIICVNDDGSIVEMFAADTCVLHEILEGMGV